MKSLKKLLNSQGLSGGFGHWFGNGQHNGQMGRQEAYVYVRHIIINLLSVYPLCFGPFGQIA